MPSRGEQKRVVAKVPQGLSDCDEAYRHLRERRIASLELLTDSIHHLVDDATLESQT